MMRPISPASSSVRSVKSWWASGCRISTRGAPVGSATVTRQCSSRQTSASAALRSPACVQASHPRPPSPHRGASLSASGSIGLSRNPSRSNGNTSQSATSPTGNRPWSSAAAAILAWYSCATPAYRGP